MVPMGAKPVQITDMICMTNLKPPASHRNRISQTFFEIQNFTCPRHGLGLLGSLRQMSLIFDPHSLQGIYLGYLDWVGYASYPSHLNLFCQAYGIVVLHGSNQLYTEP